MQAARSLESHSRDGRRSLVAQKHSRAPTAAAKRFDVCTAMGYTVFEPTLITSGNNAEPCQNCVEHGEECVYVERRVRKKMEPVSSRAALEKKVAYYEELFRQGQTMTVSNNESKDQASGNTVDASLAQISNNVPQGSLQAVLGQATSGVSISEDAQVRRDNVCSPHDSTQSELSGNTAT